MTMLLIAIALAVVLLIIAVPRFRQAVLSLLGLLAVITIGSAVFAAAIWGIYQARPLSTSGAPALAQGGAAPEEGAIAPEEIAEANLAAEIAEEDEQELQDEKQRQEEKKLRIELLAARARVILEEDRKLAEQAASFPLPSGADERLGDIMAIRIPAWRDKDVAAAQKESIRAWLQTIGLTAEETASIVTAKAWGSLYDIWISENSDAAPPSTQQKETDPASSPARAELPPDQQSEPESEPESELELEPELESPFEEEEQELPLFVDEIPLRREVTRPQPPRRFDAPRRPPPARRPPSRQEREVGPFGY